MEAFWKDSKALIVIKGCKSKVFDPTLKISLNPAIFSKYGNILPNLQISLAETLFATLKGHKPQSKPSFTF